MMSAKSATPVYFDDDFYQVEYIVRQNNNIVFFVNKNNV